eukprot:gene1402-2697_t
MEKLEQEICNMELQIKDCEENLARSTDDGEKAYLRKKEEQLRTKKEQLRTEKLLLLQKDITSAMTPPPAVAAPAPVVVDLSPASLAAIREIQGKSEEESITISNASDTVANNLTKKLGFAQSQKFLENTIDNNTTLFDSFDWAGKNEDQGMERATLHIKSQLSKFYHHFDKPNGFKIVDIHRNKSLLDVCDDNVGTIHGGSDVAIVPTYTVIRAISQQISVLFELKSTSSFEKSLAQATIELVAARCLSEQPQVMVVLTDLCTGASVLRTHYDCALKQFVIWEYNLSLTDMAILVSEFLMTTAVPRAEYMAREGSTDPRDEGVLTFKRTKLCTSEIINQHLEMLADAKTIQEKAEITSSLLRLYDMDHSSYLSMYL